MNRLTLIHPSTLTGKHNAETYALYNAFDEYTTRNLSAATITYKLPSTGALIGPFGLLLHTPPLGRAFLDLTKSLPALPPRLSQIIALVVAAYERSTYHFYVHSRLALQSGINQQEIDSLQAGLYAQSFSNQDQTAYHVARKLCVSSGAISDRLWTEATKVLGSEGAMATVMHTAYHRFVCTLLRGFDSQVPAEGERVENSSVPER